ncbi:MAG: NAD(P)/FAD-dependent oxidoreductase, partial [Deltaproteobacteria bacterium]
AKAVCIEKEPELGGTCLRIGCIPTKAWVQTAFFLKEAEESFAKLGIKISEPTLDFATANEWKAAVVKQMTSGVASLFKANGVEWVKGTGRFSGPNTIAVEGGEDVNFKQAVVATGSYPLRPPIDGLDSPRCVDSEGLLAQTQLPGRGCGEGAGQALQEARHHAPPRDLGRQGRGHGQRARRPPRRRDDRGRPDAHSHRARAHGREPGSRGDRRRARQAQGHRR